MEKHIDTVLKLRQWVVVAHHIPGRIRLKYKLGIVASLASLNRNEIEQALLKIPALKHYKINNATGSLLVEYDATLIKPQLLEALFSRSDQEAKQACYALSAYLAL